MRRLLILFAIMVVSIVSLTSITAFADVSLPKEEGGNKDENIDVNVKYVLGGEERTVYSVDVAWGNMSFTYTSAFKGNWNPTTHKYDGATDAKWTCEENANVITVTNHSNAGVSLSFEYKSAKEYSAVKGTFDNPSITLETAEGTTRANAPTSRTTLTLSGDMPTGITNNTTIVIGTITVTLK